MICNACFVVMDYERTDVLRGEDFKLYRCPKCGLSTYDHR